MILKILNDKNPILRKICSKVERPSFYSSLALSMMTTMKSYKAVGLAANQVGYSLCIIAIDTPDFSGIMFNPEILERSEEKYRYTEGCLSIKNTYLNLEIRSKTIKVKWQNKDGSYNEKEFNDLTSVVIQHEVDHLLGRTMKDYDSR